MKFLMIVLIVFLHQNSYPQVFWELISDLDSMGTVNSLEFDSHGKLYAASYNGLFISTDHGNSWVRDAKDELTNSIITDILFIDDQNILIGTHNKGVLKTTDGGRNWSQTGLRNLWIEKIIINQHSNLFAATDDKIYKSTDGGINWENLSSGFNPFLSVVWTLYLTEQGRILAGTECGLYSTDNEGLNWNFVEPFNCGDILAINGNKNDEMILLGGDDRLWGIYFSEDQGNSWQYLQLNDTIFNTTSIITLSQNEFYIGAKISGVYKYDNLTNTLTSLNSGLPYNLYLDHNWYFVSAMALDSLGFLYITTSHLYKSREPVDTSKYLNNKIYDFSISQNYPNPFNSLTKIKFSLGDTYYSSPTYVLLQVFDILGNEIATLINEEKPAGNYEVTFNADGLSSGMYFYKLQAGNFSKIKKMMILK